MTASYPPQSKKCSPTISDFTPETILPEDVPQSVQHAAAQMFSQLDSDNGNSSIFEPAEEARGEPIEPTQPNDSPGEEAKYDLKPPPPLTSHTNAETLSERLFSVDHLNVILLDHAFNAKFTNFLSKYRPNMCPIFLRYQAIQKAKAAIDYANVIAESLPAIGPHSSANSPAAILHKKFDSRSRHAVDELISDALPRYITHRLVSMVTECLVKEITGNNVPIMRELVQGLAEVYCLSDSSLPDNPIVYASEEFYKTTQYGRDHVIGRNCRFLQGPKSARSSVNRLAEALSSGTEACETILNYRRDGSPFLNLLIIAPLYDNKGRVRYFIGCQIDVTNLVEGGRGLESFEQLLEHYRSESHSGKRPSISSTDALGALGRLLSEEEMDEIRQQAEGKHISDKTVSSRPSTARRRLGVDEPPEKSLWAPVHYGPSGRLPGVYQNVGK
jgi:PAS domain S-box-containing protein